MQLSKKQLSIIMAVVIIATCMVVSPIVYVIAASPSRTLTIGAGQYPGAPSYSIYEYSGTYYVKDQNGVEETGSDSSILINSVIASAEENAEIYFIGDIILNGEIAVSGKSYLLLDFAGASILQGKTGISNELIYILNSNHIVIQGGFFNGSKATQTTSHGIYFSNCHDCTLQNAKITDVEDTTVFVTASYNIQVLNNELLNSGNPVSHYGDGVLIAASSYNNIISGNLIIGSEEHGIKEYGSSVGTLAWQHNIISNNIVRLTYSTGITSEGNFSMVIGNVVENCDTYEAVASISLGGWWQVCADNTVQLNYGNIYGILAAHSATITGNTVSSTVYGIGVQYDCTVTGNIVENTTTRGLVVTNDRNVLSSNWVECASWAIYFGPSANKNIVSNNVITQSNGAITESGGADHNMISDINAYDCNFGIITTGANTKVNQCWNMTTWIS